MEEYAGGALMHDSAQQKSNIIEYDVRLSNFIVAYFFVQALNLFVRLIVGSFGAWNLISRGSLALLLVLCLPAIIKRNLAGAALAEVLLILCLGFTIISGGANYGEYSSIMINSVTVFMPMGIAVTCIEDKSILAKRFYIMSWPTQVILIYILLNLSGSQYSMPGGYALVFQMLIVMDHFFQNRKWYDLAAMVVDFLVILLFGSRGPIVCIMAMILIRLVFSHKLSPTRRILIGIAIVAATVFVYFYYQAILNSLLDLTHAFGYSSRNLRVLVLRQATSDSGRESIHNMYFRLIRERPVLGYGLVGGWTSTGMYPHHIFIELLLSFGVVLGSAACIIVSLLAVRSVMSKKEMEQRLAQIMLAYCVSLFLSDSFMMCPMFFLLMGLGLSQSKIRFRLGRHN